MTSIRIVAIAGATALAGGGAVLYARVAAFLPWREETEANRLFDLAELRTAGFNVERQIPRWSGPMWLVLLRRAA